MTTDLYVRDKYTGKIHRVGDKVNDALSVLDGCVVYRNMQNGDGTRPANVPAENEAKFGYEFMPTDCGFAWQYDDAEWAKDIEVAE